MVLTCQAVTFGVRPLMLCYDQPRFAAFWPIVGFDEYGFHFASACGLVSTVLLIASYETVTRRGSRPLRLQEAAPPLLTLTLSIVGMLLAVLAIGSTLGRSRISFDPSQLVAGEARGEIGKQMPGHGYETFAWLCVPIYVGAVAAAYLKRDQPRWLIPLLVMVSGLVILLPIGGRTMLIETLAVTAYVWHYRVRPLKMRYALAFAIGAFVLSALMGNFRAGLGGNGPLHEGWVKPTLAFDGFEGLVAISRRLSIEDVVWGRSYVEDLFYTMIPRVLWTDKPHIFGGLLCEAYVYPDLAASFGDIGTYPVGYISEALFNFWYLGLLVVPVLLGVFLGWSERAIKTNPHLVYPVVVAAFTVGDAITVMRGLGGFALEILTMPTVFAFLRMLRPSALPPHLRTLQPPQHV
jgi:oligosaccharide repeat unit polymerase